MKIIHRKGSEHSNADALSRIQDNFEYCDCYSAGADVENLPCGGCAYCRRAHTQWSRFDDDVDDVVPLAVRSINAVSQVEVTSVPVSVASNWTDNLSNIQLSELQHSDSDIGLVMTWLEHGYDPPIRELQLTGPATRSLWLTRSQLVLEDGVLYYSWVSRDTGMTQRCLVVPSQLQSRVLYFCHSSKESGHLGQAKTLDRLRDRFYWYGMSGDSTRYVKQCGVCNRNKKTNRPGREALGSYHAGYPMERVHLDIVGPFHKSRSGNRYILVMVDQFTKWVELAALPEYKAPLTAKAFIEHFISTFGCPLECHTDQGQNFMSTLFQTFCKVFEITQTRTSPYHPSGNGQCEVFNRTILQMVRSYISKGLRDWDEHLPLISMALHSMKNRSTGFSANMMMLGRETLQPIDIVLGRAGSPQLPSEWVADLVSNLSKVHEVAREKIGETQLRQKRDYDLRLLVNKYHVGDVVYLRDSSTKIGVSKKLRPPWAGPFIVLTARSPLYTIQGKKKSQLVHHDRLKPCHDADLPLWLRRKRHVILDPVVVTGDDLDGEEDLIPEDIHDVGSLYDLNVDLDATLPYILDPEGGSADSVTSPAPIIPADSQHLSHRGDDTTDDSSSQGDPTLDTGGRPGTRTRAGKKLQLPARYRD